MRFASRSTTLSEVLFECYSAGLLGIKQTFLVGLLLLSGSAWADKVLILDDQYFADTFGKPFCLESR